MPLRTLAASKAHTSLCRLALACTFAIATFSCLLSSASASIVKGDEVKLTRAGNYGGAHGGGEFRLWKRDGNGDFVEVAKVFCLEYDESIQLNTVFKVGSVSTRAVLGGANTNAGDDLDFATDLLYRRFAEGTLDQVDLDGNGKKFSYGSGGDGSNKWNNAFQRAVWVLEEERSGFGNYYYSDEAKLLHDWAVAESANQTEYSGLVWALNLFSSSASNAAIQAFDPYDTSTWDAVAGKHKQDQLWYFDYGDNSGAIPEPGTVLIWSGLGLAMVGYGRHRRRKAKKVTKAS